MTALKKEQWPRAVDPAIFRSRLALLKKMGSLDDEGHHQCGRCMIVFDDQGNCTETQLIPPANLLPAAS
jgi:hypothetical protein